MTTGLPSSPGRVAGKIALVTGAGSGIGRATAVALAAHGATVGCADLNLAGAEQTAASIAGKAWACRLDVTSEASWQEATGRALRDHGRLDIVVNSAGISFGCAVSDMVFDDWRRVMAVNLDGVFLGTKYAILAMRQAGHGGSIVNVSSVSGIKAQPEAAAYCTSKAGVIMLSKSAALECAHKGEDIRVNCISPAGVKTPLWETMPFFQELMAKEGSAEAAFQAMGKASPYGRWALPEEVALAILYLASDESSFVTGTNLMFDNGYTA